VRTREVTDAELDKPLTPYPEALAAISAALRPLRARTVAVSEAEDCILAADVFARKDIPGFSNSAMDGYAVRSTDLAGATPENPVTLPLQQTILAGGQRPQRLRKKTCSVITTGAPMPPGADTVVPFEEARRIDQSWVAFIRESAPGKHVRPADDVVSKGTLLAKEGARLTPPILGLLSQCGIARVKVHPRPRAALIVTGDEIVLPGEPLRFGMVYDANSLLMTTILNKAGCNVAWCKRVSDQRNYLEKALHTALDRADLVCVTGGASVGPHDWAKEAVGDLLVWRVGLKPGKPFGLSLAASNKPVLLLPGNPGSALAAFCAFGFDIVSILSGRPRAGRLRCHIEGTAQSDPKRICVQPVRLKLEHTPALDTGSSSIVAVPVRPRSSASLMHFAEADGVAFIPQDWSPGQAVEVLPYPWWAPAWE
jgi:molybdopterin molybdotransferase